MIRRASIGSNSINISTKNITINFTVNDNLVYNGFVYFYDNSGNYISYSKQFRDETDGNLTSMINNGTSLNTSGTNNELKITNDDLTFTEGKSFGDISGFFIGLLDGKQYANQGMYYAYDCVSFSAKTSFSE